MLCRKSSTRGGQQQACGVGSASWTPLLRAQKSVVTSSAGHSYAATTGSEVTLLTRLRMQWAWERDKEIGDYRFCQPLPKNFPVCWMLLSPCTTHLRHFPKNCRGTCPCLQPSLGEASRQGRGLLSISDRLQPPPCWWQGRHVPMQPCLSVPMGGQGHGSWRCTNKHQEVLLLF